MKVLPFMINAYMFYKIKEKPYIGPAIIIHLTVKNYHLI